MPAPPAARPRARFLDGRPRPAAGVEWTVELDGIALWRRGAPGVRLAYPEAAGWDFIVRGLSRRRAVRLLAALCRTGEDEAERTFARWLVVWRHRGWIEIDGDRGDG